MDHLIDLAPHLVLVFAVGVLIGRFLNLCIVRFPRDDSFVGQLKLLFRRPRACDGCGIPRSWWQCLPLTGLLSKTARCGGCRRRIPRRFAVVELLTGGLLAVLYAFELQPEVGLTDAQLQLRFLYHAVMFCALIVATFIDFDLKIIPDGSTLPAMAVGVLGGWLLPYVFLTEVWYQQPHLSFFEQLAQGEWSWLAVFQGRPEWIERWPHLHGLAVSLAGLVVGGGIVWSVRIMGERVLGREAIGFGDVILLAMIGSFVGWQAAAIVFFLAPLFALMTVVPSWIFLRNREIPFGPYLSLAAVVVVLFWQQIWENTDQIFSLGVFLPVVGLVMLCALASLLGMWLGIKRLFGFEAEEEFIEEWTSGDQLSFLANEVIDPDQGQWRRDSWPGGDAGRGRLQSRRWRGGGGWQ
ncbi:Leader peptidase PppA [Symmachiella dynata]|uniref:prepilin peptidase n=1 Tax=Symmachiella dynata TaxID=2527995 RepID=UPI00118A5E37|nr:A24 family peptidase [Symmachiella dynata]QDT47062.1 Leader peptidase PppA [Symmachiella dynata]